MTQNHLKQSLSIVVGIVFLVSAIAKITYLPSLQVDIKKYLEVSSLFAHIAAAFLIAWEGVLGGSLILYRRSRLLHVLAIISLGLFSGYLLTLDSGIANCGCFGFWLEMSPMQSLIKNLVAFGVCGFCLKGTDMIKPRVKRVLCFVVLLMSSTAVLCVGNGESERVGVVRAAEQGMQGEQVAQNMKDTQVKHINELQKKPLFLPDIIYSGVEAKAHLQGKALIVFVSASCHHCKELAQNLAKFEKFTNRLYFNILDTDEREVRGFLQETGNSKTPWALLPVDLFFDHIESSPPRVYLLDDGVVVEHWDDGFETLYKP